MQRARISALVRRKWAWFLALRAIMIVKQNKISWRNNVQRFFTIKIVLNTLDPEFLRMRISKKKTEWEYCKEISAQRLNNLTLLHANFYIGREDVRTRTECK